MPERRMSTGVSLLAAMIPALFAANSAVAQVGTVVTTPTLTATSPLGAAPGALVEPTGIPLGATEITSQGLQPGPHRRHRHNCDSEHFKRQRMFDGWDCAIVDVRIHCELRWRRDGNWNRHRRRPRRRPVARR